MIFCADFANCVFHFSFSSHENSGRDFESGNYTRCKTTFFCISKFSPINFLPATLPPFHYIKPAVWNQQQQQPHSRTRRLPLQRLIIYNVIINYVSSFVIRLQLQLQPTSQPQNPDILLQMQWKSIIIRCGNNHTASRVRKALLWWGNLSKRPLEKLFSRSRWRLEVVVMVMAVIMMKVNSHICTYTPPHKRIHFNSKLTHISPLG